MYINIKIELKGQRTRGATMIDYFKKNNTYNAYLVRKFNEKEMVKEIIESYAD